MLSLAAIKAQLLSAVPTIKTVRGAASLQAALEAGQFQADAYVVRAARAPSERAVNSGQVSQRVLWRVAVIHRVRVPNDLTGERADEAAETQSNAVITALLGFAPGTGWSPMLDGGGRLLAFAPPDVIWVDEFTTTGLQRSF